MERYQYQRFATIDRKHWWFGARRQIADALIKRFGKGELTILDYGTGSGGMLPVLAKYGRVTAFEPDISQFTFTKDSYQHEFPDMRFLSIDDSNGSRHFGKFDLLTAFDVLEHCEDDVATLELWKSMINDDGRIMITVPAFQCLWGRNDVLSRHYRRYTVSTLNAALRAAGLVPIKMSYINSINFVPVWISRNIKEPAEAAIVSNEGAPWDLFLPPAPINFLLEASFAWEKYILPWVSLPVGTSLVSIVQKDPSAVAIEPTSVGSDSQ